MKIITKPCFYCSGGLYWDSTCHKCGSRGDYGIITETEIIIEEINEK